MSYTTEKALAAVIPALPKAAVERVARRYVAGSTLADATRTVSGLERAGRLATLDVLGEELRDATQVEPLVRQYLEALDAFDEFDLKPTLSVRMTALGLLIDPDLPWANLQRLATAADEKGRELTIDMEASFTVDATFAHYRRLREAGFENVGIVLQACLRRTIADVRSLSELRPRVRVVKGIWVEPYAVAHADYDVIRDRYVRVLDRLLDAGSYVEIATHDEWLVERALDLLEKHGRAPHEYEFQMLLGVRRELGDLLVGEGHRLRVYVPFGQDWYAYCLRRLKENPAVVRNVTNDLMRRLRHDDNRRVSP